MMWRINPDTSQVAVLSFPRDLWVTIDGRQAKQRINVAYERDNPQKLINTIYQNFGIVTDHFIQVDFCAFQKLVNAVDGVTVPFATPVQRPEHRPQRARGRAASRSTATTRSPTCARARCSRSPRRTAG